MAHRGQFRVASRAVLVSLLLTSAMTGCDGEGSVSAPEYIAKAENHLQQGDPEAAIIELRNAVKLQPDNPEYRYRLGKVYLDIGKGADASKEFRRARELGSTRPDILQALARAWLLQGDADRVLAEANAAEQPTQAGKAEIQVIRGDAALAKGDVVEAKAEYRKAFAYAPNDFAANLGLARAAIAERDFEAAEALIERADSAPTVDAVELLLLKGRLAIAKSDFTAAVDSMQRVVDSRPNEHAALRGLAQAQIGLEDYEAASKTLETLESRVPGDGFALYLRSVIALQKEDYQGAASLTSTLLNQADPSVPVLYVASTAYYHLESFEQAAEHLERLVAKEPSHIAARRMLGATLLRLEQPERAFRILKPLAAMAETDADLSMMLGVTAFQSGFREEAVEHLQRAVDLRPDDPALRERLGTAKIALGRRQAGLEDLERAIVEGDGRADLERRAILERISAGQLDEALAGISRYQENHPERADGWVLEGLLRLKRGEREPALAAFSKAEEIEPAEPNTAAALALLHSIEGDMDAARSVLEAVLGEHPDHVSTLTNLANLEIRAGRTAEAVAYLERAAAEAPQNRKIQITLARTLFQAARPLEAITVAETIDEPTAELLQIKGGAELQASRPDDAIQTFERRLETLPGSADAHLDLALALEAVGEVDEALASVDEALTIDPGSVRGQVARARLRLMQIGPQTPRESIEAALTDVKALMDAHPGDPNVLELRGLAAMQLGRWPDAVAIFQLVQSQRPTSFTAMRLARAQWMAGEPDAGLATLQSWADTYPGDLLVQSALARAHLGRGQFEKAVPILERLLEANGEQAPLLNDLAWSLHKLGRPADARLPAEKAYDLEPDNPGVADTFGVVMMASGDLDQAVSVLARAAENAPDNGTIQYHYAQALSRAKRTGEARAALETALAGDRAFPERSEAERLLDKLTP